MALRLEKCDAEVAKTGIYPKSCLFDVNSISSKTRAPVDQCFSGSFEEPGNLESGNKILRRSRDFATNQHIELQSQITINDYIYRGDIDFVDIREAICAAYGERPDHCNLDTIWESEESQTPYLPFEKEKIKDKTGKGLSKWLVATFVLIIFLGNLALYLHINKRH